MSGHTAHGRPIRVFVVEDSVVARELLVRTLRSDPGIEVIGTAADGEAALAALETARPDVVTMDIHMPKLDGFETTRRLMETHPVPVVVVTASANPNDVKRGLQVMEAGAVAILEKPRGPGHPGHSASAAKLIRTVKLMSEVRVVKRWRRASAQPAAGLAAPVSSPVRAVPPAQPVALVAIGASTGGPPVLHTILEVLPKSFPVPILIVQHIARGFAQGLADWLAHTTPLPVHVASHGVRPEPGHVYIAPDDHHMLVERSGRLLLNDDPPEGGLRPAVSVLFRSVARVHGGRAIGVLLTGMGRDGADELKLLRDHGAVTIAQDRESAVVFGMPGEAVKLGAAAYVLPPQAIAATLDTLLCKAHHPAIPS